MYLQVDVWENGTEQAYIKSYLVGGFSYSPPILLTLGGLISHADKALVREIRSQAYHHVSWCYSLLVLLIAPCYSPCLPYGVIEVLTN